MRKATLSKLAKLIVIIQILMAVSASVANASNIKCAVGEYYNPSEGMIIKSETCWDDSITDHEVDDSLNHETILSKRLPEFGETGFKGE